MKSFISSMLKAFDRDSIGLKMFNFFKFLGGAEPTKFFSQI